MRDLPPPPEGLEITLLGASGRNRQAGGVTAAGAAAPSTIHAVVSITLSPGAKLPETFRYPSALLTVDSGRVEVEASDGPVELRVGRGRPIQVKAGGAAKPVEVTDEGDLEDGRRAVLGRGNGVALEDQACRMRAVDGRKAVIRVSLVLRDMEPTGELCWICPHVMRF